jgi:hypothetical protein
MSAKVVDMSEIISSNADFKLPLLSELLNQELEITDVRTGETDMGKYAVVSIKGKGDHRITSPIVVKQLEQAKDHLEKNKGDTVKGTLKQPEGKRYYTF